MTKEKLSKAERKDLRRRRREDRRKDREEEKRQLAEERRRRKEVHAELKQQGTFYERFMRARRTLAAEDKMKIGEATLTDFQKRNDAKRARMTSREAYEFDTISFERNSDVPHFSAVAIYYVWSIYRRAAGKWRYFPIISRLLTAIYYTVMPLLSGALINEIITAVNTRSLTGVSVVILLIAGLSLVRIILSEVEDYATSLISQNVSCYVMQQVATKYIRVPLVVRETSEFADKFTRASEFAGSITYVSDQIVQVLTAIMSLIATAVAVLTISPFILLVIACSTLPYTLITLRASRRNRMFFRRFSKDRRMAFNIKRVITDSSAATELELNGLSEHFVSRMVRCIRRSEQERLNEQRRLFMPSLLSRGAENLISFAVLFLVIMKIVRGEVPIGSFVSIRDLLDNVRNNIYSLSNSINSVGSGIANATDYMEFMETPNRESGDVLVHGTPNIEFKNVSFSYPSSKTPALKNVSFSFNAGESIAIVGENGAGKTTLIKLLIGAYEPDEGEILINGHPLAEINMESYWRQIGALFQDYSRYDFATLGENVQLGDIHSKYSKKRILDALKLVGLEDLPSRYEKGLDQIMSKNYDPEFSADLSGGQWQRVCIARAFYRSPNMLLLDEPTSAVDAKAEYEIFQNIIKSQQGKSTVIISHRFSTVRKAQKIIVLDKGEIVERGTHEELLAQNGHYAEMFNMQAEGYN